MLDIKFIREHAELVRKDLEKRNWLDRLEWLDIVFEKDKEYRKLLSETQDLRHKRNTITLEINALKKDGKDIKPKLQEAKELPNKIKELEETQNKLYDEMKYYLMRIPNVLHESVPFGKDDSENQVVKEVGHKRKIDFELKAHGELIQERGLGDFEKAAEVSGNGFYYLMGDLALLDHAIQRFAIDIITKKGYTLVQTPFMLRRKPYEGVTDLADFENVMYKIEGEDLYMIATSEHPIAALHMGQTFEGGELPKKYCGLSACFRKEIGSHGIDTKGLFRVHQFNKIEQFVFCKPEDSWKYHEELIENAETIFRQLKIPYRVVNICTGDIGIVAAKKFDIEAWMPREEKYREVVSCSNCTGYQAVRLGIKYKKGEEKEYIHTFNSTAVATGRCIRAIIENYQEADGRIKIPDALLPYMNGKEYI